MYFYLPLSYPLSFGFEAMIFDGTFAFLFISLVVRAAAVLGWVGVVLHEYVRQPIWSHIVIFLSGVLSFASIVVFIRTGWPFSWGAIIALAGGIFMMAGVIMENLGIEIIAEKEECVPQRVCS